MWIQNRFFYPEPYWTLLLTPLFFGGFPRIYTQKRSRHQRIDIVLFLSLSRCFSFPCLIAFQYNGRTSSIILNRSGEGRHSCVISIFIGKPCHLLPLNVMLAVFFLELPYIKLRGSFLIFLVDRVFLSRRLLNFIKCFFCINLIVCFLYSIDMLDYIDIQMLSQPCIPGYKFHFVMVYNPFYVTVFDLLVFF